jgi:hypothetical protein
MTGFGAGADEWFEPSREQESMTAAPEFQSSNVCRVAALGTMFHSPPAWSTDVAPALADLGFPRRMLTRPPDWREENPFRGERRLRTEGDPDQTRVSRWLIMSESGSAHDALAFVVAVLGSSLEREVTAAAAMLWRAAMPWVPRRERGRPPRLWRFEPFLESWDIDQTNIDIGAPDILDASVDADDQPAPNQEQEWNPERWRRLYERVMSGMRGNPYDDAYLLAILARARLSQAVRSPDPVVRQLAMAAFAAAPADDDDTTAPVTPRSHATGALVASTMIHGTWGWKGDWWRPHSTFHDYILRTHRPNLFSRGARFSWSGAYNRRQRVLAARDFLDWSYDIAPHGVQTLFAHSYGGDIAARAISDGASVHELVLLSVPVSRPVRDLIDTATRIIDVRLSFDPVLALARTRQRMPDHPAVTPVIFSRWTLDHGATHSRDAWEAESVASRGRL